MSTRTKGIAAGGLLLALPNAASAHCPLCTAGAGALAILAASLGISSMVVGVFVGAFALALALWIAKLGKREFVPFQRELVSVLVFFGTVLPIMPLVRDYGPLYLSLGGEYGTLLHNTYTINLFVAGIPLGMAIILAAPHVSRLLTKLRHGRAFPYQGLALTFLLLIAVSSIIEVLS